MKMIVRSARAIRKTAPSELSAAYAVFLLINGRFPLAELLLQNFVNVIAPIIFCVYNLKLNEDIGSQKEHTPQRCGQNER